jgi:hypothetical protein
MSDTPRTDAAAMPIDRIDTTASRPCNVVHEDVCRQLERELAEARDTLKQCLSIMPVGYVPTHTMENLPEMIGDLAKALAEETTEREQLEHELAEVRKQRDTLAEAMELFLSRVRYTSIFMNGNPKGGTFDYHSHGFDAEVELAHKALATVKGGSDE